LLRPAFPLVGADVSSHRAVQPLPER